MLRILRAIFAVAFVCPQQTASLTSRQGMRGRLSLSMKGGLNLRNPIRPVITMLQEMIKDIKEDGMTEQKLFDDFMCLCTIAYDELAKQIQEDEARVEQLKKEIKSDTAWHHELRDAIAKYEKDREDAQASLQQLKEKWAQDVKDYQKRKFDGLKNMDALAAAIDALEKGMGGSFLQTPGVAKVKQLTMDSDKLSDVDRDAIMSFITARSSEDYEPQSGEIIGILKVLRDEIRKDMKEDEKAQIVAKVEFEAMVRAKEREIEQLSIDIREYLENSGELGVKISQKIQEKERLENAIEKNKELYTAKKKDCEDKQEMHEKNVKTRGEEIVALQDCIGLLEDDDSLLLFKKTLKESTPEAFIQTRMSQHQAIQHRALDSLMKAAKHDRRLNFLALVLKGSRTDFGLVIKKINEMIKILIADQDADNAKSAKCMDRYKEISDKLEVVKAEVKEKEEAMEKQRSDMKLIREQMKELEDGLRKAADELVQMEKTRKEETKLYLELRNRDLKAVKLLEEAKDILFRFYKPELAKAAVINGKACEKENIVLVGETCRPGEPHKDPEGYVCDNHGKNDQAYCSYGVGPAACAYCKAAIGSSELQVQQEPEKKNISSLSDSEEDRAMEEYAASSSFLQVRADDQDKALYTPTYEKSHGESNKVLDALDKFLGELDTELTMRENEEKAAQADYEAQVAKYHAKEAADRETIKNLIAQKRECDAELLRLKGEKKVKDVELQELLDEMDDYNQDCGWFQAHFNEIEAARKGEIQALEDARFILNNGEHPELQS